MIADDDDAGIDYSFVPHVPIADNMNRISEDKTSDDNKKSSLLDKLIHKKIEEQNIQLNIENKNMVVQEFDLSKICGEEILPIEGLNKDIIPDFLFHKPEIEAHSGDELDDFFLDSDIALHTGTEIF